VNKSQVQGERGSIYRRSPRVRVSNGPNWAGLGWPKIRIRAALIYFPD
jgi:hypothetical protein